MELGRHSTVKECGRTQEGPVEFSEIQMRCRELSHVVPGKTGDVLGMAVIHLDGPQQSGEVRTCVVASEKPVQSSWKRFTR